MKCQLLLLYPGATTGDRGSNGSVANISITVNQSGNWDWRKQNLPVFLGSGARQTIRLGFQSFDWLPQ